VKLCLACRSPFSDPGWKCPSCGAIPQAREGCPVFAPELSHGDGSDAEYLDDELVAAEARHFWFHSRRRLILWALRRYLPQAESFLEIGCGTGFVLSGVREALPRLALAGSDVRVEGLARAGRRLPGVALLQMDARRIPFRGEFDAIGAFDVIEHLVEDEAALREMHEALRPGGGIILTVPQHPFLWSAVDDFSRHKRRYTRRELVAKVEKAGFEVIRATSFNALLLPLLLFTRTWQRLRPAEFDPAAELRVGPALNGMLGALMKVEERLIRSGLSFPAGGSLLLVAKRR
jgi:SAM-dependent methyltransferase